VNAGEFKITSNNNKVAICVSAPAHMESRAVLQRNLEPRRNLPQRANVSLNTVRLPI
jgi:hypothetical protein